MNNYSVVIRQAVMMYILMIVGAACCKTGILNKDVNKKMTDLLLQIINPIVILMAYQVEFTSSRMEGLLFSFGGSIVVHLLAIGVSHMLLGSRRTDAIVERYACVFSNSVFMGLPLIQGLYGDEGVFYLTAFAAVSNLFMWTYGVSVMQENLSFRGVLSAFRNPSLIAIFVGLLFFVFQIPIPDFMGGAFRMLVNMNTPLAMLVAGASIMQTSILCAIQKKSIWYITGIKMIIIPLVSLLILSLPVCRSYPVARMVVLVLMSCPTATHTALMSLKYDKNYLYATEIFAITTILSSITLPLMILAGEITG